MDADQPDQPDQAQPVEQPDQAQPTEQPLPTEPAPTPSEPAPFPLFPSVPADGGWWQVPPPPPPASDRRSRRRILAAGLAALVLMGAGIGIGWGIGGRGGSTPAAVESPLTPAAQAPSASGSLSAQAIADRVSPALVDVNTVIGGLAGQPSGRGAGTGMILSASGEVLTNNHVIAGASSISVTVVGEPTSRTATVIGADPTDDVALLQIQGASGLPTVALAQSSTLNVGQRIVAIGNALGRGGSPTVTEGVISALGQDITVGNDNGGSERLTNLIETDASISPGDSGGALVNESGQVVGMITAASRTQSFEQASQRGFAIPVNDAVVVVNQIRSGQETSKVIIGPAGFIGVEVRNPAPSDSVRSGALVLGVIPGTPAAKAGITAGSVITEVDGTKIDSADALAPVVHAHDPGERIKVSWLDRNGNSHSQTITLIAGPAV